MTNKYYLLSLVVTTTLTLAGCSSWRSYPDELVINGRYVAPVFIVNLTMEDLPLYPPLKELLEKWEASDGKIDGFSIQYPYEKGLELVKALQERVPNAKWPASNYVPILYKGKMFDVIASKVHADG